MGINFDFQHVKILYHVGKSVHGANLSDLCMSQFLALHIVHWPGVFVQWPAGANFVLEGY